MRIRSIRHRGLRRFVERGDESGLPAAYVTKVAAVVSFLQSAPGIDAVRRLQAWKVHLLTGDRKGVWSLSVSRNWRLTFRISADGQVTDLDFEDYH